MEHWAKICYESHQNDVTWFHNGALLLTVTLAKQSEHYLDFASKFKSQDK